MIDNNSLNSTRLVNHIHQNLKTTHDHKYFNLLDVNKEKEKGHSTPQRLGKGTKNPSTFQK